MVDGHENGCKLGFDDGKLEGVAVVGITDGLLVAPTIVGLGDGLNVLIVGLEDG